VSGDALAFALAAAAVHAGWNLVVGTARDPLAALALALPAAVCVGALPAALTWQVSAEAVPYRGRLGRG
jgi:hypothetical protein